MGRDGARMQKRITVFSAGWIYAFIHFSVEVASFYFLFSRITTLSFWWIWAMLFDALAFLPQSFIGVLLDKYPHLPHGTVGCAVMLVALLLPVDILALVFIALGNALVHVDGAQRTLRNNQAKLTPNAVFVGGGSFGVITGQLLCALQVNAWLVAPIVLLMISAGLALLLCVKLNTNLNETEHLPLNITKEMPEFLLVGLVLFAVAVRSYIAYAIPIEWKKTTAQAVALFVFMGIGKMLGGVSADYLGFRKTTYLSLLIALPFLLFGNAVMVLSLVGVMLFSMTMPITVGILVSKYPNSPGFAFGITTVGLFLGVVPAFFILLPNLLTHQIVVFILSITALVALLNTLKKGV